MLDDGLQTEEGDDVLYTGSSDTKTDWTVLRWSVHKEFLLWDLTETQFNNKDVWIIDKFNDLEGGVFFVDDDSANYTKLLKGAEQVTTISDIRLKKYGDGLTEKMLQEIDKRINGTKKVNGSVGKGGKGDEPPEGKGDDGDEPLEGNESQVKTIVLDFDCTVSNIHFSIIWGKIPGKLTGVMYERRQ